MSTAAGCVVVCSISHLGVNSGLFASAPSNGANTGVKSPKKDKGKAKGANPPHDLEEEEDEDEDEEDDGNDDDDEEMEEVCETPRLSLSS